jgi:hypothetical protein
VCEGLLCGADLRDGPQSDEPGDLQDRGRAGLPAGRCQGSPCETSRCTLLGCGQVRYDYACGCSVIIRFQKHGDILVTYAGF